MIGLLLSFGINKRAAQVILYVVAPILVVLILWLALSLYGSSRYKAGERAADARWVEAGRKLEIAAAKSAEQATKNEAPRIAEHQTQVRAETERIDEAVAAGSSPFDVLFGGVR